MHQYAPIHTDARRFHPNGAYDAASRNPPEIHDPHCFPSLTHIHGHSMLTTRRVIPASPDVPDPRHRSIEIPFTHKYASAVLKPSDQGVMTRWGATIIPPDRPSLRLGIKCK